MRQLFDGRADVTEADAVAHHGDLRIAAALGDVDEAARGGAWLASPMKNVAEVSPWKPFRHVVTSILTMSPGPDHHVEARYPVTHRTSFWRVHTAAGNPW